MHKGGCERVSARNKTGRSYTENFKTEEGTEVRQATLNCKEPSEEGMHTLLESDCAYQLQHLRHSKGVLSVDQIHVSLRCAHARNKTLIFGLPSVSVYPLSGTLSVWLCFSGSVKTVLETWEEFMGNFPIAFN